MGKWWKLSDAGYSDPKVVAQRGTITGLATYLGNDQGTGNFMIIGGGSTPERELLLESFIADHPGTVPMIILHPSLPWIESRVLESSNHLNQGRPWKAGKEQPIYEPLIGMTDRQVTNVLRGIAKRMEYTITSKFDRIVQAHTDILRLEGIDVCLSSLLYLSRLSAAQRMKSHISSLPCSEADKKSLFSEMRIDQAEGDDQLSLFRTVIFQLAEIAESIGWKDDNHIYPVNCRQVIEKKESLVLSVGLNQLECTLPYLVDELKTTTGGDFLLIMADLWINGDILAEILKISGCHCGIMTNCPGDLFAVSDRDLARITEKMDQLILFKHANAASNRLMSQIMGQYECLRSHRSTGTSKGFFRLMPKDQSTMDSDSVETRYRIMPEMIMGLRSDEAIIFDKATNYIILFSIF